MKILIIQTSFPGDTILASSLIESIHASMPNAQIHFLLRKGNESLFMNHPILKKLWIWDKSQKFKSALSLILSFRKEKFDYIVNVQRFFMTGAITLLSSPKKSVGFDKNPLSSFFSSKVKHEFKIGLHETQRNYALIQEFASVFKKPKLYPPDIQITDAPFVVLAPASVWFTKQWPEEYWIELGKLLQTKYSLVLLGGPADVELCARIEKGIGSNVLNTCGKYKLLESAGIIRNAKAIVCNDSAPAHLATAVNTPTVQIFCSTTTQFGFTADADKTIILQTEEQLTCRPCNNHGLKACPLKHFACARSITPSRVEAALLNLLA